MEQIHNLITGRFVEDKLDFVCVGDNDESEDEDDDADMAFNFRDSTAGGSGKNVAGYHRPKLKSGNLVDLPTGKLQRLRGRFHLSDPWWQMIVLRTKTTKDRYKEPKDPHALCYKFRNDEQRFRDKVVHMFISNVGTSLHSDDMQNSFHQVQMQFENYLKSRSQYEDLELLNLEQRLDDFVNSLPEEEAQQPIMFKTLITAGAEYRHVKLSQLHPQILRYGSQLFPYQFNTIISFEPDDLADLAYAIDEEPGNLAFKAIVSKKYKIVNCETSAEALIRSGLFTKIPQHVKDAIKIYEYLKRETKDVGHTYIHYNRIMDVLGPVVELFEEALEFLNKQQVTKTQMDSGYRIVYLMPLWLAECKIARGLNSLHELNEEQPWPLEVDFERPELSSICEDGDQSRAAKLITSQPVVAISGKGGCGKTYVVTKVLMAAHIDNSKVPGKVNADDADTQPPEGDDDDDDMDTQCPEGNDEGQPDGSISMDNSYTSCYGDNHEEDENGVQRCPREINILLTAPTGKAANLLGKRAHMSSFTLHQVIWSFPPMKGTDWKHKDVNVLVVDECSLVSVTTFSRILEILTSHADLRRIILLGDVRQLPSIEPGYFLADTFQALERIGCAVELRTNHRAESQLIVDNATRISKRMFPTFDDKQFILRKLPESDPTETGNDYLCQDISEDVRKLLMHEKLQNDYNSQFISFTRKVCDSINDLCCYKYSNHRIKENGRYLFRTNDKICCTKNGYVDVYTEVHGLMSCKMEDTSVTGSQKSDSKGGLDWFENSEDKDALDDCSTVVPDTSAAADSGEKEENKPKNKKKQVRLCNGEIFFILNEVEKQDEHGSSKTFLHLSDKDPEEEFLFWVEKRQLRKMCRIRHAWARTIHTFQGSETDHVVYIVGSRSKRQNWQHVYTAITRGRKTVFIVSVESILRDAVKRSEIKRQTGLRKQLVEKFQKNPNFNATLVGSRLNHTIVGTQTGPPNITMHTGPQSSRITAPGKSPEKREPQGIMKFLMGNKTRVNANLNTTKELTDVLSSLAADHDSDGDIEEYDSDASDSLLTQLKPSTSSGHMTVDGAKPSIRRGHTTVNGPKPSTSSADSTDIDLYISDDDDSLIKPRTSKHKHTLNRNMTESKTNGYDDEESQSLLSNTPSTEQQKSKASIKLEELVSENNAMDITVSKRKGRLGKVKTSNNKTVYREGPNTTAQPDRGSVYDAFSPVVKEKGLQTNPAPVLKSNTPQCSNKQNCTKYVPYTSSPYANEPINTPNGVRTGNSLFTPGYTHSFTKVTPPGYQSCELSAHKTKNHDQDDYGNPKSNESQWSDMNDSEYLNIDDTSLMLGVNKNSSVNVGLSGATPAAGYTPIKQSPFGKTPSLFDKSLTTPLRTPNQRDISTNSLWSEADDEQYLTLDIDDIQNMTKPSYHDNFVQGSDTKRGKNRLDSASRSDSLNNSWTRRSPEVKVIETPPSSPSSSRSSSRSRSDVSVSPGNKRPTSSMDDSGITSKRRQPMDKYTVSPLKSSMAKLDFK